MVEKKRKESLKSKGKKAEKKNFLDANPVWPVLAIFLLAFILYGNTIKHEYALDDDMFTRKNAFVQKGFSALPQVFSKSSMFGFNGHNDANYRPLVLLNFMFEKSLWGNNPHVHHFFNVFLFALTGVLLFLLLKKLLKSPAIRRGGDSPTLNPSRWTNAISPLWGAGGATLLFLFHPVHTEVVANIKSRDEILGFLFGVLSFNFIVDYIDKKKIGYLILSLVAFFLASLSKESAIMFAVIIPLMIFFFRNESIKKITTTAVPFFVLIGIYWMIRMSATDGGVQDEKISPYNNSLMAATNMADRYATNFVMLGKYVQLLFFPHPLSYDYSYNQFPVVSWGNISAIISFLIYLGMGVYIFIRIKKKDVLAFAMLYYLIMIFPTSNLLVKFGGTFAERFLYSPSLGFCIAIPFLLSKIFKTENIKAPQGKRIVNITLGIILFLFGIKTYSQNEVWANNYTLFTAGILVSPNSARAHSSLASEYRDRGEAAQNPTDRQKYLSTAVDEYKKAIEIYPTSDTYYNLGVVYYDLGDIVHSKEVYEKSMAMNPLYAPTHNNLGVIFIGNKNYDNAEVHLLQAVKLDPAYADAYANLGVIYHNKGQLDKAVPMYEKAIEFNPRNINVYNNLTKLYLSLGDTAKAGYYENAARAIR